MESHLSNRLAQVAAYVPKGAKLLDVGSDHAYLPIFLVESNQISAAIAGEVVKDHMSLLLKMLVSQVFAIRLRYV